MSRLVLAEWLGLLGRTLIMRKVDASSTWLALSYAEQHGWCFLKGKLEASSHTRTRE